MYYYCTSSTREFILDLSMWIGFLDMKGSGCCVQLVGFKAGGKMLSPIDSIVSFYFWLEDMSKGGSRPIFFLLEI